MKELPQGGLIGKTVLLVRVILALRIRLHAASACYFIVLAVFPALEAMRGTFLFRLIMVAFKLLLLPLVVSITYEINRWAGGHDNFLTRIISAPGMWMQNFTTNEPDDAMIEVGIAAVQAVLPSQEGSDRW